MFDLHIKLAGFVKKENIVINMKSRLSKQVSTRRSTVPIFLFQESLPALSFGRMTLDQQYVWFLQQCLWVG